MAKPIKFDEKLEIAAQLTLRTRIFFDIWWLYEGSETRPEIIDAMRRFPEFFRFDPHAHFVSFIVYISALFENRRDTINLTQLKAETVKLCSISDVDHESLQALFKKANPLARKAEIIRNKVFAHRSAQITYAEVFKAGGVKPDELRLLTEIALKIINRLLMARNLPEHNFNKTPLQDAKALLEMLRQ